jgi:hypothetical protein
MFSSFPSTGLSRRLLKGRLVLARDAVASKNSTPNPNTVLVTSELL